MLAQLGLRPLYFAITFFLLAVLFIFCLATSRTYSFELLNSFHSHSLDTFFIIYTNAGDGLFTIAVAILLVILKKRKEALTLLAAYITSGLFAQLLKAIFREPRPVAYFKLTSHHYTHFVEGVTLYSQNSFPSGHSVSAFAMATVFALVFKNSWWNIFFLLLALLVGYSRIYLGEHFLPDVLGGASVGILFAMASYYFLYQKNPRFLAGAKNEKPGFISFINNIRRR